MIQKLKLLPVVHLPRHQQPRTGFPPPGLGRHRIQTLVASSQLELQRASNHLVGVDHQSQRVVGSEPAVVQGGDQPAFGADVVAVHRPAEAQIEGRAAGMNLLLAQGHQPW